jgi:hypothetical protein
MACKSYCVAENRFAVTVAEDSSWPVDFFSLTANYEPFEISASDTPCVFTMTAQVSAPLSYVEEVRQDEEDQQIYCGRTDSGEPVFDFYLHHVAVGMLVCSLDYKSARLLVPQGLSASLLKFAVNNALMVLYALATANTSTLLFHAAVVEYGGKGYLFLGKSGTGKSTHARLWLKYNEGSELLNDDNPVVRFYSDRGAVVYGSPWSGKTPCYKNREAPVGGIVLLSQAPFNKISRLRGVQAYAAIISSISGKRWDRNIADGLHQGENALASHVPVWYLECLPDEEAAKICRDAVTGA